MFSFLELPDIKYSNEYSCPEYENCHESIVMDGVNLEPVNHHLVDIKYEKKNECNMSITTPGFTSILTRKRNILNLLSFWTVPRTSCTKLNVL